MTLTQLFRDQDQWLVYTNCDRFANKFGKISSRLILNGKLFFDFKI